MAMDNTEEVAELLVGLSSRKLTPDDRAALSASGPSAAELRFSNGPVPPSEFQHGLPCIVQWMVPVYDPKLDPDRQTNPDAARLPSEPVILGGPFGAGTFGNGFVGSQLGGIFGAPQIQFGSYDPEIGVKFMTTGHTPMIAPEVFTAVASGNAAMNPQFYTQIHSGILDHPSNPSTVSMVPDSGQNSLHGAHQNHQLGSPHFPHGENDSTVYSPHPDQSESQHRMLQLPQPALSLHQVPLPLRHPLHQHGPHHQDTPRAPEASKDVTDGLENTPQVSGSVDKLAPLQSPAALNAAALSGPRDPGGQAHRDEASRVHTVESNPSVQLTDQGSTSGPNAPQLSSFMASAAAMHRTDLPPNPNQFGPHGHSPGLNSYPNIPLQPPLTNPTLIARGYYGYQGSHHSRYPGPDSQFHTFRLKPGYNGRHAKDKESDNRDLAGTSTDFSVPIHVDYPGVVPQKRPIDDDGSPSDRFKSRALNVGSNPESSPTVSYTPVPIPAPTPESVDSAGSGANSISSGEVIKASSSGLSRSKSGSTTATDRESESPDVPFAQDGAHPLTDTTKLQGLADELEIEGEKSGLVERRHRNDAEFRQELKRQLEVVDRERVRLGINFLRTDSGLFECTVCNKQQLRFEKFKQHALVHFPRKPFRCCWCQKQFRSPDGMVRHVEHGCRTGWDHMDLTIEFRNALEEQKQVFAQKMERHGVCAVKREVGRYACSACDKEFMDLARCTMHAVVHIPGKHYKCIWCDKFLSSIESCIRHARTICPNRPNPHVGDSSGDLGYGSQHEETYEAPSSPLVPTTTPAPAPATLPNSTHSHSTLTASTQILDQIKNGTSRKSDMPTETASPVLPQHKQTTSLHPQPGAAPPNNMASHI